MDVVPLCASLSCFIAVYGLVTFNYGKFGSELFYGSIISFWLIYHIINLTFAIFCALGRPIYRSSERFTVDEAMVIEVDDDSYQVRVCDFRNGDFILYGFTIVFAERKRTDA